MDAAPPPPAEAPPTVTPLFPPMPARRRFSWRDFFFGIAAGMVLTVLGVVLLAVGASMLVKKMIADDTAAGVTLTPPEFPAHAERTIYGHADTNWTFHALTGEPFTLADYRGKVVFLNFWATWCGPCVMELPDIQKLQQALKDDPVVFALVSDEDAMTIQKFAAKKPMGLPLFRTDQKRPPLFVTDGIPTTFIIDPGGLVVYKDIGAAGWSHDTVISFIRGLLPGAASPAQKR